MKNPPVAPTVQTLVRGCLLWSLCLASISAPGQSAPLLTQDLTNESVLNGAQALFTVAVSGPGPFRYRWEFNGQTLPTSGYLTNIAGNGFAAFSGDAGPATNAALNGVYAVAADIQGDIFIADRWNNRIRKVGTNGVITTIAGNGNNAFSGDNGPATNASISTPSGVAVDAAGNLFIADTGNNRVRKVDASGVITTIAGNGSADYYGDGNPATNAALYTPCGLACDASGNIYIGDCGNEAVRRLDPHGIISTVAHVTNPYDLAVDPSGAIDIAQEVAPPILQIDTNGLYDPINVQLPQPTALAVDPDGNLSLSDYTGLLGEIIAGQTNLTLLSSDARFAGAYGMAFDGADNLFVANVNSNQVFEFVNPGPSFTIPYVTPANAGSYDVVISNPYGAITSSVVSLTVLQPPQITAAPTNITVPAGETAAFSVTASGTAPFSYQWSFNGAPITGETNESLALQTYATNAGSYTVVVTNAYGSQTSAVATLSVSVITAQPVNQNAPVGANATFTVTIVGAAPYAYQWLFDGIPLSNQTNSVLTLTSVQVTNSGSYQVIVSNIYASVTSSVAVLTVDYPPSIVQQPAGQAALTGATVSLNVVPQGTGPFTYQWQHNGTNITNGIIATLAGGGSTPFVRGSAVATNVALGVVLDVAAGPNNDFFLAQTLSNRICRVDSNGLITVFAGRGTNGFSGDGGQATNAALNQPTTLMLDSHGNLFLADANNNRIRRIGTNGIITTVAGGGKNAPPEIGDGGPATNATLSLNAASLSEGYPSGIAEDSAGNLFICDGGNSRIRKVSTNGIITTIAGTGIPSFSGDGGPATNAQIHIPIAVRLDNLGDLFFIDSGSRVREIDTNAIIHTIAGGGGSGGSPYSGGVATNFFLSGLNGLAIDANGSLFLSARPAIQPNFFGYVYQIWTNGLLTRLAGTNTGRALPPYGDGGLALRAYLDNPTGLSVQNSNRLLIADTGYDRISAVTLSGPSLTLNNLTTNDAGTYDVIITGPFGVVTSAAVSLTVWAPPSIVAQPSRLFVPVGQPAALSVTALGTSPLAYQWLRDGLVLTAETNNALDFAAVDFTNTASYQVVITNLYGAITSAVAPLSVGIPPQITAQPQSNSIILGASGALSIAVSGSGPFSYQWQSNGTNLLTRLITTFAGGGTSYASGEAATNCELGSPQGVALDADGRVLIADTYGYRARRVDTNGIITTIAGNGIFGTSGDGGLAIAAELEDPDSVALDAAGNIYLAGEEGAPTQDHIRRISVGGVISTLFTNAYGTGIAVDSIGDVYFSSVAPNAPVYKGNNNAVFKFSTNGLPVIIAGSAISTSIGDNGPATNAMLSYAAGFALDSAGNLFIADRDAARIRRVSPNGIITTVAGDGATGFTGDGGPATNAQLNHPVAVAVDNAGNIFIADYGNNRVRQVTPDGLITTIAGNGVAAFSGDGGLGTNAALDNPSGIAADNAGNIYIADPGNNRIRLLAQGPSFLFTNISLAADGNYDVIVTTPYGSVTSALASVTVVSPPQNLAATLDANGNPQFQFSGTPNDAYVLQVTTNLTPPIQWQPLITNPAAPSGQWTFTETNLANPARFYRALLAP